MNLIVVICFARSGGTLLSRILKSDPRVILASEINFKVGATTDHQATSPEKALVDQMSSWYGIDLDSTLLNEMLRELVHSCSVSGKQLIWRDWTYIDFFPSKWNQYDPALQLTTTKFLSELSTVRQFAFVRNAIDVYLSMGGDVHKFGHYYLTYIKYLLGANIPVIKYEDLIVNPDDTLNSISKICGVDLAYNVSSISNIFDVTGDTQLGYESRGARAGILKQLPRKRVPLSKKKEIMSCGDLMMANELLGYENIFDNNVESHVSMIIRKLQGRIYRIFRKS